MNKKVNKAKYYEIYVLKNPVKQFEKVKKMMMQYEWSNNEKSTRNIVYYDTPKQNLQDANIMLSTDISKQKSIIVLERNIEDLPNEKFIKLFEIYRLEEDFQQNERITDHLKFLSASLPRLFTQPITIDPDSIFKKVAPQLQINFKNTLIRVVDFKGFKGIVTIEDVEFNNFLTKRKNYAMYLKVEEAEDSVTESGFEIFVERLEKYCKFILPINDSVVKQAQRMTKRLNKDEKIKTTKEDEVEE